MEFDENIEPPKKKLKQAQLPFCNQTSKINKQKCSNDKKYEINLDVKKTEEINIINSSPIVIIEDEPEESPMEVSFSSDEHNISKSEHSQEKAAKEACGNIAKDTALSSIPPANCAETISNANDGDLNGTIIQKASQDEITESEDTSKTDSKENESCINSDSLNVSRLSDLSSEDEKHVGNADNAISPLPDSEISSRTPKRKLTPKAIEKRQHRDSLKQEKLNQREKEKEAKLKLKLEKEEHRRREKEEREEQKKREKEEKERKRLAELKQKEEEKRKKEEAKEEEKRRKDEAKEEEKRKKEEAKLIEQRKEDQAKKAFSNFFILKKTKPSISENSDLGSTVNQPKFMPFPVKPDMRLAVVIRRQLSDEEKVNVETSLNCNETNSKKLYLNELKDKDRIPLKSEATWPLFEEQHDVIIVESAVDGEISDGLPEHSKKSKRNLTKAKLLQFHENRRPAYWGTWRKKSSCITSRRPFLKEECLNYEVDSDSEWEDEGEGEDIGNEGDSDKEQSDEENSEEKDENGYILDNTFVPHGYLSDEEVQPDEENFDPEDQKLRLKVLRKEFEEEMKSKTERLKPRLLGCVWISNDTTAVSKGSLYEMLMKYRAVWDEDSGPITVIGPSVEESPTYSTVRNKQLPQNVMEQLVKFVHGNHLPFIVMVQEFRSLIDKENLPIQSKRAISLKIKEIARKEFVEESGKQIWSVNNELCSEYGLIPLSQLNSNSSSEKVRDSSLVSFFKRPSTSPLPNKDSSQPHSARETPAAASSLPQQPSTPAPVKKRATLITLTHTPINETNNSIKVHKDTPRPVHTLFRKDRFKEPLKVGKTSVETIDLCDDI